ncbi:sulfite exporter TauE/SafE family protein [Gordonia sp. PDNC005]|uniref:sulfite exporter TauE/SafE family protein n=1 Tax=unclassified Gordonia (in: high G+C Gram-positive bacteria) TaxID=2657482 RepID=UPI001965C81B|nr:sulfite exporter TauE/SafE family protein [Gordonia sp. PDNC005]QRY64345.1 sulfite exporter TauE/SafE family protein [Gordonia sp. PDNC005]
MTTTVLLIIGVAVGVTTVLFGFGGGFVTVPVITIVDAALGDGAIRVATATSALVMVVNAAVATASTRRRVLARLGGRAGLVGLLAFGGALGAWAGRLAPDSVIAWGFVAYVAVTVLDLVLRPGFVRRLRVNPTADIGTAGLPTWTGVPIGTVAAFLGVGGSVMTVPLLRRAGSTMTDAAALANPLTLAIVIPAVVVSLAGRSDMAPASDLVGSVDVRAAAALLAASIPVVVLLRRRPPTIPDRLHAIVYIVLLIAAGVVVATVH